MNEIIPIVAIVAAAIGAIASTIQGYWDAPQVDGKDQSYSGKKLVSALLSSCFTAFGLVNIVGLPTDINTVTWTGLIMTNMVVGFGIDKAHSVLDK